MEKGFIFEGVCDFNLIGGDILIRKSGTGIKVYPECLAWNALISGVRIRGFGGDQPFVGIDYDMQQQYWTPSGLNRLTITDCQVQNGMPAIRLGSKSVRTFIRGNLLIGAEGYPAIQVEEGADLFTITDNILQQQPSGESVQPPVILVNSGEVQKVLFDNLVDETY